MSIRRRIREKYNSLDVPEAEDVLPAGAKKAKKDKSGGRLFAELAASGAVIVAAAVIIVAGQGILQKSRKLAPGGFGDETTGQRITDTVTVTGDADSDTGETQAVTAETGDTQKGISESADLTSEPEESTTDPHVTTSTEQDVTTEPEPQDSGTDITDYDPARPYTAFGLNGDETISEINEKLVGRKFSELKSALGDALFSVDGDKAYEKLAKKNWPCSSYRGINLYKIPYDSKNCLNVGVSKSDGRVVWAYKAFIYEDSYDILVLRGGYGYDEDPVIPLTEFPPSGTFILEPDKEMLWGVAGFNEEDLSERWGAPASDGLWNTENGMYTVEIIFNSKGYAIDLICEKSA